LNWLCNPDRERDPSRKGAPLVVVDANVRNLGEVERRAF